MAVSSFIEMFTVCGGLRSTHLFGVVGRLAAKRESTVLKFRLFIKAVALLLLLLLHIKT